MVAVAFEDVTKSFGAVQVLHGVSFELAAGRVIGLLGENGAGKSTLMKILAGYEAASGGSVRIDGEAVRLDGHAAAEGTRHRGYDPPGVRACRGDLTIAQNVFLGYELRRGWWLDEAAMRAETLRVLRQVGLAESPDTPVRQLIVAEKQLVEIAKALRRDARVLILDEPTATLTPSETERLFGLVAQLKARGVTMVYISHKLDEIERITDEVIVMRDGRFVARSPTADVTRHQMANLMVGREIAGPAPAQGSRACKHPRHLLKRRGPEHAPAGRGTSPSRSRLARSSASPASSAPAARSCSRACWGCALTRWRRSRSMAARCACAAVGARRRDYGLTYLSEDRKSNT